MKARRQQLNLAVSRKPINVGERALRSGNSSSAEVPTVRFDTYDDFSFDDGGDGGSDDENAVEGQNELLFDPYEEAFQAWKHSFRQQCVENWQKAADKEYDQDRKAAAKREEELKEQSISLFSAIQGLLDYQLLRMLQTHPDGMRLFAASDKDPLALWKLVETICLYPAATTREEVYYSALHDYTNFPACPYNQDIYVYNERYNIVYNNYLKNVGELPKFASLKHYVDRIKANKFDTTIKRVQADLLENKGASYTLQSVMKLLEELDLKLVAKKNTSAPVYGAWGVKSSNKGRDTTRSKSKKESKDSDSRDKAAAPDGKKRIACTSDNENRVCYHCNLPGHLKNECQVLRAQSLSGKEYKCCEDAPVQQHYVRASSVDDTVHEPCVPILSHQSYCGSVQRKDEVLEFIFDPGSQETITSYPHTLSNKTKGPRTAFESMAGFTSSCVQGDLGPFGRAYLAAPDSNIILLSQASMRKQFGDDMHVYFNNNGNYYDVTLHGVLYRFEADDNTDKPLYKLKLPISEIHVNTVLKNEEGMSRREREKNRRCIRLISDAGYNDVKEMLAHGMITECEETSTEVAAALRAHGYPAGWHQGKTVTKSSKLPRIEPALPYLIKQQDLEVDLMFTAGVGFLISVSRPLGMTVITHIGGKGAQILRKAMQVVLKLYEQRGFQLRRVSVDGESGIIQLGDWLATHSIQLDPRAPGEHVKLVERKIRVIKERVRCHLSALPFKLPYSLLKWLVMYCVYNINMIPYHDGAGYWVTPREMFTGRKCNRKRNLYSFGEYVQVKTVDGVDSNSVELPRTEGGIVLLPTGCIDGGVMILLLRSMRVVRRTQMTRLPMPDTVIQYLTAFALSQKKQIPQQPSYIVGTRALDEIEDEKEIYDEEPNNELEQVVEYVDLIPEHEVEEWIEDVREYYEEEVIYEEHVPDVPLATEHGDEADIQATPTVPLSIEDDVELIEPDPPDAELLDAAAEEIEPAPPPDEVSVLGRGKRERRKPSRYVYNMTFAQAKEKHGDLVDVAQDLEAQAFIARDVFDPVYRKDVPAGRVIMPSKDIYSEKLDAEGKLERIKGRYVAGGHRQDRTVYDDVSSPTVSTEAIFVNVALAARERRHVVTLDVGTAYLYAHNRFENYMELKAPFAAAIVKQNPKWKKYLDAKGKMVVRLKKALYGCIESALLWYEYLTSLLGELGFKANAYEPCVLNAIMNEVQVTITLHVDDLLLSSVSQKNEDTVINFMQSKFEKITVHTGKVLKYLGMLFDFTKDGEVTVSMDHYIEDVLAQWNNEVKGVSMTPATGVLFNVDTGSPPLARKEAERFHSTVAKLLYAGKRVRIDILTATTALTTRVQDPREADMEKLLRIIRYLKSSKDVKLKLRCDELIVNSYIDASYGVHPDMKSHSGSVVSLGSGAVSASSTKQKINTKSSCEAELTAVADKIGKAIWIRNYLIEQGYEPGPVVLHQDNQATMQLLKKGYPASDRTRHINIKYFFVSDLISRNEVKTVYLETGDMVADGLTKPLQGDLFRRFRTKVQGGK